jgi:D-aminoacyl-tRNA deacylase
MRTVIQRVTSAEVRVNDQTVGKIGKGMLILAGFEDEDNPDDLAWMTGKILNLRIFNDDAGIMNRSVLETGGEILVVSQFTLHASTRKGNRPSYIRAARPEKAEALYDDFRELLTNGLGKQVSSGVFGAMMMVSLINDGPVTILIDSRNRE